MTYLTDFAEPVWLPWPDHARLDVDGALRVGDEVRLNHIARPEWYIRATVVHLTTPGRAVLVKPDEPITSPANWVIVP